MGKHIFDYARNAWEMKVENDEQEIMIIFGNMDKKYGKERKRKLCQQLITEEVHLNLEMNRNGKSWKFSESLNWILEYLIMVNFEKYLLK